MRRGRAVVVGVALAGCQGGLDAPRAPVALDRPYFDCRVQPVLTKYCAALACHGDADRFFTVFARNRLRLDGDEAQRNGFLGLDERDVNFAAAAALVDPEDVDASPLVRKPLAQAAGGAFHVGATRFGGADVFADTTDPDYQILSQWLHGATEVATCQEPGSNL
ncbi:MAG: hypothetical protein R3B06_17985 [Kofleriaceae bacterium]